MLEYSQNLIGNFTFVKYKQSKFRKVNEAMEKSITQYCWCRHHDANIVKHTIPYILLRPFLNIVLTTEEQCPVRWKNGAVNVVLLLAEWNSRSYKPDSLNNLSDGTQIWIYLLKDETINLFRIAPLKLGCGSRHCAVLLLTSVRHDTMKYRHVSFAAPCVHLQKVSISLMDKRGIAYSNNYVPLDAFLHHLSLVWSESERLFFWTHTILSIRWRGNMGFLIHFWVWPLEYALRHMLT